MLSWDTVNLYQQKPINCIWWDPITSMCVNPIFSLAALDALLQSRAGWAHCIVLRVDSCEGNHLKLILDLISSGTSTLFMWGSWPPLGLFFSHLSVKSPPQAAPEPRACRAADAGADVGSLPPPRASWIKGSGFLTVWCELHQPSWVKTNCKFTWGSFTEGLWEDTWSKAQRPWSLSAFKLTLSHFIHRYWYGTSGSLVTGQREGASLCTVYTAENSLLFLTGTHTLQSGLWVYR